MAEVFISDSFKKPCQIDVFVFGMFFDLMIVYNCAKSILNVPHDGVKMLAVAQHQLNLNFHLVFN